MTQQDLERELELQSPVEADVRETYTEVILRFRVHRFEQMPETHGGGIRKHLVASFDDCQAAWDCASDMNIQNDASFWNYAAEDHGEAVRVERPVPLF